MIEAVKKIRGPRGPYGRGRGQNALVSLHPPLRDDLDAWIATRPDPKPSRPEAIRQLAQKALAAEVSAKPDVLASALRKSP